MRIIVCVCVCLCDGVLGEWRHQAWREKGRGSADGRCPWFWTRARWERHSERERVRARERVQHLSLFHLICFFLFTLSVPPSLPLSLSECVRVWASPAPGHGGAVGGAGWSPRFWSLCSGLHRCCSCCCSAWAPRAANTVSSCSRYFLYLTGTHGARGG